MNREIKFRGKIIDTNEWIYGYYGWSTGNHYITVVVNEYPTLSDPGGYYTEKSHNVHKDSIGQFTGLLDKNGKEIYENDKLLYKENKYVIEFLSGMFKAVFLRKNGSKISLCTINNESKIIGNVFESPELLNQTT